MQDPPVDAGTCLEAGSEEHVPGNAIVSEYVCREMVDPVPSGNGEELVEKTRANPVPLGRVGDEHCHLRGTLGHSLCRAQRDHPTIDEGNECRGTSPARQEHVMHVVMADRPRGTEEPKPEARLGDTIVQRQQRRKVRVRHRSDRQRPWSRLGPATPGQAAIFNGRYLVATAVRA